MSALPRSSNLDKVCEYGPQLAMDREEPLKLLGGEQARLWQRLKSTKLGKGH
jgi:hypothetical protein